LGSDPDKRQGAFRAPQMAPVQRESQQCNVRTLRLDLCFFFELSPSRARFERGRECDRVVCSEQPVSLPLLDWDFSSVAECTIPMLQEPGGWQLVGSGTKWHGWSGLLQETETNDQRSSRWRRPCPRETLRPEVFVVRILLLSCTPCRCGQAVTSSPVVTTCKEESHRETSIPR
jgi:hypothetical protein